MLLTSSPKKRIRNPKYKYPLIVVIWDDAEGDTNWQASPQEPLKPTLVTSVGFLIRDDPKEDRILIADSYIDDSVHTIGGTNKIPRGMIKLITYLNKNGFYKT